MRRILHHWLIFIALFALLGEPLIADAHLSIDGDICSAVTRASGQSNPKAPQQQHNHDCCVAITVFSKTAASDFSWRAEPFGFAQPGKSTPSFAPTIAWQLLPSRAPPVVLA